MQQQLIRLYDRLRRYARGQILVKRYYEQPKIRIVYTCMDAKNTVQPAVPIQPDFAQLA